MLPWDSRLRRRGSYWFRGQTVPLSCSDIIEIIVTGSSECSDDDVDTAANSGLMSMYFYFYRD